MSFLFLLNNRPFQKSAYTFQIYCDNIKNLQRIMMDYNNIKTQHGGDEDLLFIRETGWISTSKLHLHYYFRSNIFD